MWVFSYPHVSTIHFKLIDAALQKHTPLLVLTVGVFERKHSSEALIE